MTSGRRLLKRTIDIVGAGILIAGLSPVMGSVALAVRMRLGRPIFFRQVRPGLCGEPFTLVKFRTMTDERDATGALLPNEQRKTRFGNFLRRASLDELPELINVLRGEMSLVGPRPLLMEYVPLFSPRQAMRMDVKPGITGWAQINGRNALSWEDRFELDVWYVENQSLFLDLRILFRTISIVLLRKDVSPPGQFTIARFRGTPAAEER